MFLRLWPFLISLLASLVAGTAQAGLMINVNYSGDAAYQSAFTSAAAIWQSKLTGYQNGVVVDRSSNSSFAIGQTITGLNITAVVQSIDGAGGILGKAGPTEGVLDQLNFVLATDGTMEFDSADAASLLSSGQFESVVLHEMAHVLGFGTLWELNGVYVKGSGEYTGAYGTAAWQVEFNQSGTPDVELGGSSGTANSHWNEVDGGAGLTGIVDASGRDMRDELMTGWLNPNSFISNMTVQSFRDIGFTVNSVPEPGSLMLAGLGVLAIGGYRHLRKRPALPLDIES